MNHAVLKKAIEKLPDDWEKYKKPQLNGLNGESETRAVEADAKLLEFPEVLQLSYRLSDDRIGIT